MSHVFYYRRYCCLVQVTTATATTRNKEQGMVKAGTEYRNYLYTILKLLNTITTLGLQLMTFVATPSQPPTRKNKSTKQIIKQYFIKL